MEQKIRTATFGRRGVLAIGAAVAAGIAMKEVAQPVAAANVTATTFVANSASDVAFVTQSTYRVGVNAIGTDTGVFGSSANTGVSGSSASGNGVVGSTLGGNLIAGTTVSGVAGVMGSANGDGNFGVLGISSVNNGKNTIGVWGNDKSAATGGIGVRGDSGPGIGVLGQSTNAMGLFGKSVGGVAVQGVVKDADRATANTIGIFGANLNPAPNSHGIIGLSQSGHGLIGTSNAHPAGGTTFAGLVGLAGVPDANAGSFFGNVAVAGNLLVTGSQTVFGAKSAALAHPDGSHRLVYCVEAPESWLEDFGEGTLAGGKAEVKLDPDFTTVADMASYHVFITTYADSNGHYVANRTGTGFTVMERNKGTGGGQFSWRVVAKRKDIKAARLARVDKPALTPVVLPDPNKITAPAAPATPTPPKPPSAPQP